MVLRFDARRHDGDFVLRTGSAVSGRNGGFAMSSRPFVIHSRSLPEGQSGELLRFTREGVEWEWMSMSARRLNSGEAYAATTNGEEAVFVILGGLCSAAWGNGEQSIGKRKNVFEGFPYCVYLPHGHAVGKQAGALQADRVSCLQ